MSPVKGHIPAFARRWKKDHCERCGITEAKAKATGGLGQHHRDEDRTNNTPENFLTLCAPCHTREHWLKGKQSYKKALRCYACSVLGVSRPADKRGLCETHRTRARRHGSPYLYKKKVGKHWILMDERKEKGII